MWYPPYGNALVLVGFHIDFALVLLAVAQFENNLIKKKKKVMEYYFSKTINDSFENNRKLQQLLKWKDLVLTEIDLKATLKRNWM
jgi:hypothetical protein